MKIRNVLFALISTTMLAVPSWAQTITKINFRDGVKELSMGEESQLVIRFEENANSVVWCGLQIRWGDGSEQMLRIGDDNHKKSPTVVRHTYNAAGNFVVDVEGKTLVRGLKTAVSCGGNPSPISISVVDKKALAEQQRQNEERQRLQQQAEADRQRAEQMRQEADRRQREFAEKELELKRRELAMKEEMLKREEELRRRQPAAPAASTSTARPVAPAPAPAPAPAAVKPADGF